MFLQNRNNLIKQMKPNTAALFYSGKLIVKSGDQTFPFEVNRNFYYLTGINQHNVILLLLKTNHEDHTFLFVEEPNHIKALWGEDILSFAKASLISKIKDINIKNINLFDSFLFQILNSNRNTFIDCPKGLYFDLSNHNLEQEITWGLSFSQKMFSLYPFLKIYNSAPFLISLRQNKNIYEITQVRKAVDINLQALNYLLTKIKSGIYEYQIAAFFHYFLEKSQTQKAFETIVASGKNALILHYNQNSLQLNSNELLLLDAGVTYNHYSSDITRCYPINGVFTSLQKQLYNLVLKANKEIIAWVKPQHTFAQLNQYGKAILTQGLSKLSLLEKGETIEKYCYHSLGHHLGLDVHDVCNYSGAIGENSLITVEPGLYLSNLNIGIRIEDNVFVTSDGSINLSENVPKEITEIEALMSSK